MDAAQALKIEGLVKSYKSGFRQRTRVLSDLGLQVERGEVYGLLGRNGAGKSTTFRLLMGLGRPDAGAIDILGGRPGERRVLLRVGYCPENPQFSPNLRTVEVLRFHAALTRSRVLTPRNRIDWLLEQFELTRYKKSAVSVLSRGTVQRLALAVAFLARPELLILDEPLTGLDPLSRQNVLELLLEQKRSGTAMIVSSHILGDLEDIADRLGVLAEGRLKRELRLGEASVGVTKSMEIRIPPEFVKDVQADVREIESVRQGGALCFGGIPFEQAQELVKNWSAAGIPILEVQADRAAASKHILKDIIAAAGDERESNERAKETV